MSSLEGNILRVMLFTFRESHGDGLTASVSFVSQCLDAIFSVTRNTTNM